MLLTNSFLESAPHSNGTMAGNQAYLQGNDHGQTYARVYESFGGSDDLRKKISTIGNNEYGLGYKKIGEDYSYTPFCGGMPFSSRPTSMQGGGFFFTVKTCDGEERFLNCFAYALGTFGYKLGQLAKKDMTEIQKSVSQTIDHIVSRYFTNVIEPEDGDLAVYSVAPGRRLHTPRGIEVSGTTHAGVYRKSKPNWNSPSGGSIESKWGWLSNPYVFQHDVFFTPDFYGDQVKFYRIKKLD